MLRDNLAQNHLFGKILGAHRDTVFRRAAGQQQNGS
jgi:hypothetical protein